MPAHQGSGEGRLVAGRSGDLDRLPADRVTAGVGDRLLHGAARRRLQEVMRQFRKVRLGSGSLEPLKRLTDAAVQPESADGQQLVVQGFPHERVGEAVATWSARHGDDYAR